MKHDVIQEFNGGEIKDLIPFQHITTGETINMD
jgi:hypothetical protein